MSRTAAPPMLPSRSALRRVWLARLGTLGAVIVAVLLGRWAWRDDEMAPAPQAPQPSFIMEHPSLTARENGAKLWQFDAAQIEPSPDGSQTFAHHVSNGVLFRGDKPILHLSADSVRLNNTSKDVEATGGVKASGNDQFSVASTIVRWNYARKLLLCPAKVEAKLRDWTFVAPNLNFNWQSGELACNSPVELQAPGVRMKATSLIASTKNRHLQLGGGTEMSFDVSKVRPQKWPDLFQLPSSR